MKSSHISTAFSKKCSNLRIQQVLFLLFVYLFCFGCRHGTNAQSVPSPVVPESQPLPETELLPPPEELIPPLPTPEPGEPALLDVPGTMTVKQFKVVGSTVFTPEELAKVLEAYTNRPMTFTELLEAQTAITQLYLEKGYITSGAFISPQTLTEDTVVINVIEGEVEEIQITGLQRLKPGYISSRLEEGIQTPLNQSRLLNTLRLLQLNPLIERLSAELTAGSGAGLSRLEIQIKEAKAFSTELVVDNQRSPSVGSVRRGIEITHNNLTGRGDRLNFVYYNTEGSHTLDNLSYTLPINGNNGTLTIRHRRTWSDVIEEPFNQLDIESNSQTSELTYRQPIDQTPSTEFAIGFSSSIQDTASSLEGEPFPLSRGANDDGKTRISALRFFQEFTTRTSNDVLVMRSQFSIGIDLFDATISSKEPDSEFFSWRGQAQYLRQLAPDTLLLIRSDLQLTNQALVPIEQFSLGGAFSVRGYRQDALLADNGLFLSAEVRVPILRIPEWKTLVQLTPFLDWGTIWNHSDNQEIDLGKNTLSSVGLGLQMNIGENFTANLDWGIPLVELEDVGDSIQEDGIYFTIRYRRFF